MSFTESETSTVIKAIIEQHAEEAAFLWTTRDRAVHSPNYSLKDLSGLEERVEAHLDGLRVAEELAGTSANRRWTRRSLVGSLQRGAGI